MEISTKFTLDSIREELAAVGFDVVGTWTDTGRRLRRDARAQAGRLTTPHYAAAVPDPRPDLPLARPALLDLSGRTALVTGAGSADGIGFACARRSASLGARVAVAATTDRAHDRAADLAGLGIEAVGVVADLTDEEATSSAVARVRETLGPVGVLVNNAGMTSLVPPRARPRPREATSRAPCWRCRRTPGGSRSRATSTRPSW